MNRLLFFLIFSVFLLSSCEWKGYNTFSSKTNIGDTEKYATGITEDEKVELAIQRKKELRTIRKADYLTVKNNPQQAIAYYHAVLEKLPNDIIIKKKLAHAYFLMKDWGNAYKYYSEVPLGEMRGDEYKEVFSSLFFDETHQDRIGELKKYTIDASLNDYYTVLDRCYSGIHNCVVSIESYSGSSSQIIALQKVITGSVSISPDFQYRNFLLAAELYKQGSYRAVDILTDEILTKRPNYKEVRKLRAFTLYELGKYIPARDILLSYLESSPQDLDSIIRLGEVYAQIGDHATSNLYLNNAILSGYKDKIDIERRLAYNYAQIGDYPAMIKVLSYLLQESDAQEEDYAVAISLALQHGENLRAYSWSYTGLQLYPESQMILPLYIAALRLNGKVHEIEGYIQSLPPHKKDSPLLQLEYAISLVDMQRIDEAYTLFQKLYNENPGADWGEDALGYIQNIDMIRMVSHSGMITQ